MSSARLGNTGPLALSISTLAPTAVPALAPAAFADIGVPVPVAVPGDVCVPSYDASLLANAGLATLQAWCALAGIVQVRFTGIGAGYAGGFVDLKVLAFRSGNLAP